MSEKLLLNPAAAEARVTAGRAVDRVYHHVTFTEPACLVCVLEAKAVKVVKIGISSQISFPERVEKIQAHSPVKLTVARVVPGNVDLEAELHAIFAADRLHGEWFTYSRAIKVFVQRTEKYQIQKTMHVEDIIATHLRIGRARVRTLMRNSNAV